LQQAARFIALTCLCRCDALLQQLLCLFVRHMRPYAVRKP